MMRFVVPLVFMAASAQAQPVKLTAEESAVQRPLRHFMW